MACNLIAEIYVGDDLMTTLELLVPNLPILGCVGGTETIWPFHPDPKLEPIEATVHYAMGHPTEQSVGLTIKRSAADWKKVVEHMLANGWDDATPPK